MISKDTMSKLSPYAVCIAVMILCISWAGKRKYSHHNNPLDLRRNPSFSDLESRVAVGSPPTEIVGGEFDSCEFALGKEVDWHLFLA